MSSSRLQLIPVLLVAAIGHFGFSGAMIASAIALVVLMVPVILLFVGTHFLAFPLPRDANLLAAFALTVALIGFQQVLADCFLGHHEVGTAPLFTGGLMAGPISTLLFLGCFVGVAYSTRFTAGPQYIKQLGSWKTWGERRELEI